MNYYEEIKDKLIDVEIQNRVKDYSKNKYTLEKYYEIGKLLIEAQGGETRAKYGDGLIKDYSKKLTNELGKNYAYSTLAKMRQFYLVFPNLSTLSRELTWSHFSEVLSINNINEIYYYLNKCIVNNLSVRKLRELIKSKEYERLPEDTKNKLITNEEINIKYIVPNPIIIHNRNDIEIVKEKALQKLILDDIPSFLEQLGSGFTFIDYEYPIKMGDTYNYIDLLLYNLKYRCYVVVEIKLGALKKEHIGQIQVYMNYIDNNLKDIVDNKTIGLIVCKENNEYVIKYSSDQRILSREYQIIN